MSNKSDLETIHDELNRYFGNLVADGSVSFAPSKCGESGAIEIGYNLGEGEDAPDSFERTCRNIAGQFVAPATDVLVTRKDTTEAAPQAPAPATPAL